MEVDPINNHYLNGQNVSEKVFVTHNLPSFDIAFEQLYLDVHKRFTKETARILDKAYSIRSAIITDPCGNPVMYLDGSLLHVNFDFASKELASIFNHPPGDTTIPIYTRYPPREPDSDYRRVEAMHLSFLKKSKHVDLYTETVSPIDSIASTTPQAIRNINYERCESFKDAFTKMLTDVIANNGSIINHDTLPNFPIIEIIRPNHDERIARVMTIAYNSLTRELEGGIFFKILDDGFIRRLLKKDTDLRNAINLYGAHTPLAESTTTSWRQSIATAQTMKYHRKNIQGEVPIKNLQTTRHIHELSPTQKIRV